MGGEARTQDLFPGTLIDPTMQPIVEKRRLVIASPDLSGRGDPSLLTSLILHGLPRRYAPRNDGITLISEVSYPDLP